MIFFSIVTRWCILHSHHNPWYKIWLTSGDSGSLPTEILEWLEGSQSWLCEQFLSPCYSTVPCLPLGVDNIKVLNWRGGEERRSLAACCCFIYPVSPVTSALALRGRQIGPAVLHCDFLSSLLKYCWKNKL